MSLITEIYGVRSDGVALHRTYSDKNVYIRQVETDEVYSEAIDVENSNYHYEETDELINDNPEEEVIEDG